MEAKAAMPSAVLLSGGTDLMVEVNLLHKRPTGVVSLREVAELKEWDAGRIGAGVTWQRLESAGHQALAQLARTVGSPQIRNAGTIGGNIGTASPAGDGLPWLAMFDAGIEVASRDRGARVVPWNEFFVGVKQTSLEADEIITAAVLPEEVPGRQEFAKIGVRTAMVISTVSAVVTRYGDGRVRVALGSVAPTPMRAYRAEEMISAEKRPSQNALAEFARLVSPRRMIINFDVNGEAQTATVAGWESLLSVLRDQLSLPGSKDACEHGECGSCSVIVDNELLCSCLVMSGDCEGTSVTTIEGIGSEESLHPIQEAMIAAGAVQCGFCTPGFVVAASHLFASNPHPDREEIKEALSGNICRCTGYGAILRAFEDLAGEST
jgi:xanthine dehydrogenase iron-sulfur cluster and FAD-binding subunit A